MCCFRSCSSKGCNFIYPLAVVKEEAQGGIYESEAGGVLGAY